MKIRNIIMTFILSLVILASFLVGCNESNTDIGITFSNESIKSYSIMNYTVCNEEDICKICDGNVFMDYNSINEECFNTTKVENEKD